MKTHLLVLLIWLFIGQLESSAKTIAYAPIPRGKTISGTIKHLHTGAPIPDANITLEGTSYGTASGDGGYFFIKNVLPGSYDVTVSVMGFETFTSHGITIHPTDDTVLEIVLAPRVIPMNPIIVTATLTDHLQNTVTPSTEILTRRDMRMITGTTAGDILEPVAGLFVRDNGGLAGLKTLSIRGSNDSQVLVLLDGQRLNSSQLGGVDLNPIPAEALERVEVVRGGHSALLGTDAMGGTVHLITRESLPQKGYSYGVRSTMGSFGTSHLDLKGGHRIGPVKTLFSYHTNRSDGDFSYIHPNTQADSIRTNNDYRGENFFFKGIISTNRHGKIHIMHHRFFSSRGSAGPVTFLSPLARRKDHNWVTGVQVRQQITHRFRVRGHLFSQRGDQTFQDPGAWIAMNSRHQNSVDGFDLHTQWRPTNRLAITVGGEFRKDRVESTDIQEQARNTTGLHGQFEFNHDITFLSIPFHFRWVPSIRWDDISGISSQWSPKLGLLFNMGQAQAITFRINLSRAFRAPSFNDLFWPNDGFAHGNPDLKPEVSMNVDGGISFRYSPSFSLELDFTYFQNRFRDLILWSETEPWVWSPTNIGEAWIEGIENGLTYRHPRNLIILNLRHTWMKAIDETVGSTDRGKRLIYRPDHKIDIRTDLNLSPVSIHLNYRIIGKRFTTTDNTRSLPAYTSLNGNIRFAFSLQGFLFESRIEAINLLNQSITILEGYPIPGRVLRFSLGLSY